MMGRSTIFTGTMVWVYIYILLYILYYIWYIHNIYILCIYIYIHIMHQPCRSQCQRILLGAPSSVQNPCWLMIGNSRGFWTWKIILPEGFEQLCILGSIMGNIKPIYPGIPQFNSRGLYYPLMELVGNGGMGLFNGYYRSFPHSILRTSKYIGEYNNPRAGNAYKPTSITEW